MRRSSLFLLSSEFFEDLSLTMQALLRSVTISGIPKWGLSYHVIFFNSDFTSYNLCLSNSVNLNFFRQTQNFLVLWSAMLSSPDEIICSESLRSTMLSALIFTLCKKLREVVTGERSTTLILIEYRRKWKRIIYHTILQSETACETVSCLKEKWHKLLQRTSILRF